MTTPSELNDLITCAEKMAVGAANRELILALIAAIRKLRRQRAAHIVVGSKQSAENKTLRDALAESERDAEYGRWLIKTGARVGWFKDMCHVETSCAVLSGWHEKPEHAIAEAIAAQEKENG